MKKITAGILALGTLVTPLVSVSCATNTKKSQIKKSMKVIAQKENSTRESGVAKQPKTIISKVNMSSYFSSTYSKFHQAIEDFNQISNEINADFQARVTSKRTFYNSLVYRGKKDKNEIAKYFKKVFGKYVTKLKKKAIVEDAQVSSLTFDKKNLKYFDKDNKDVTTKYLALKKKQEERIRKHSRTLSLKKRVESAQIREENKLIREWEMNNAPTCTTQQYDFNQASIKGTRIKLANIYLAVRFKIDGKSTDILFFLGKEYGKVSGVTSFHLSIPAIFAN